MLDPDLIIKFLILLVGIGIGACIIGLASARVVAQNYDLKKQLEKVKAERNLLITLNRQTAFGDPNVEVIEIRDPWASGENYFDPF